METESQVVEGLLEAYRAGYFPMAASRVGGGPIRWLSPDPRAVIPLGGGRGGPPLRGGSFGFHVPRSLRRRVRSGRFTITTDRAFEAVIRACAEPREQECETWIDARIIGAYCALHRAGHAHSIEAWLAQDEKRRRDQETKEEGGPVLVGGLYGVRLGGAFFAESKFSRPERGGTDASKVCLVHLVHHLRRRRFILLDVQFTNPHIERFGVREIDRREYQRRLGRAIERRVDWLPFEPGLTPGELGAP